MHVLIAIIGAVQILAGIVFFLSAKSAIHEILGSLTFGLGILSFSLAAAISHLSEIQKASKDSVRLQERVTAAFDRVGR